MVASNIPCTIVADMPRCMGEIVLDGMPFAVLECAAFDLIGRSGCASNKIPRENHVSSLHLLDESLADDTHGCAVDRICCMSLNNYALLMLYILRRCCQV